MISFKEKRIVLIIIRINIKVKKEYKINNNNLIKRKLKKSQFCHSLTHISLEKKKLKAKINIIKNYKNKENN